MSLSRRSALKTMQLPAQFRKRRAAKPNPDWVDGILTKHWSAIEDAIEDDDLLPREKYGVMEELGCGAYGCVLPTFTQGVVLKITNDASEAHFGAAAIELAGPKQQWPDGIVKYYAVAALPEKYEGRDVYLLWREEAYQVGLLESDKPPKRYLRRWTAREIVVFIDGLYEFLLLAQDVRDKIDSDRRAGYDLAESLHDLRSTALIVRLEATADHIAGLKVGASVGVALRYYLDKGLLITDVHPGNVGEVDAPDDDDWDFAITDPGQMVPLDPRWLSVELPLIG